MKQIAVLRDVAGYISSIEPKLIPQEYWQMEGQLHSAGLLSCYGRTININILYRHICHMQGTSHVSALPEEFGDSG